MVTNAVGDAAGDFTAYAGRWSRMRRTAGAKSIAFVPRAYPLEKPELDITPGKPAADISVAAAQMWASIEDEEDVVEALRMDKVEDVAAVLKGLPVEGDDSSDSEGEEEEEEEDGENGSSGRGRAEPPSYANLSQHFAPLENYAAGAA